MSLNYYAGTNELRSLGFGHAMGIINLLKSVNIIPVYISTSIHHKLRDESTFPFLHCNGHHMI